MQAGHRCGAPAQGSKWVTLSPCKELTGVKQAQEVTNKSYQSSHSPERQLFILSQGGCASITHPPGLLKLPPLTQGGHKHPGARKQQAQGSNSHPNGLFRGSHNNPCMLDPPIMPHSAPCSATACLTASPKNWQILKLVILKP